MNLFSPVLKEWHQRPLLTLCTWGVYWAASLWMLGYLVTSYLRALGSRPAFTKGDIVYQEWTASGASLKNFITRIGGGRNCVRLVGTREFLWVTSWFPFSLFAPFYDMEHVIPTGSITAVKPDKRLFLESWLLTYRDGEGAEHTLRLMPKKKDEFVKYLGNKIVAGAPDP